MALNGFKLKTRTFTELIYDTFARQTVDLPILKKIRERLGFIHPRMMRSSVNNKEIWINTYSGSILYRTLTIINHVLGISTFQSMI